MLIHRQFLCSNICRMLIYPFDFYWCTWTSSLHTVRTIHIPGCNSCLVNNGALGKCTEKTCLALGQAYCSQYKDGMQCTGPYTCSAPKDCTSFFNGCNTCGHVDECGEKACAQSQQPYCQVYADGRKCEALNQCTSEAVVKG